MCVQLDSSFSSSMLSLHEPGDGTSGMCVYKDGIRKCTTTCQDVPQHAKSPRPKPALRLARCSRSVLASDDL